MRLNRNLKEEMIIKHFRIRHAGLNCHANYKTKHDTREFAWGNRSEKVCSLLINHLRNTGLIERI